MLSIDSSPHGLFVGTFYRLFRIKMCLKERTSTKSPERLLNPSPTDGIETLCRTQRAYSVRVTERLNANRPLAPSTGKKHLQQHRLRFTHEERPREECATEAEHVYRETGAGVSRVTVHENATLSRRGVGVAALTVASTGCLGSRRSEKESRLEVVSVSAEGPVDSASVHVDPGILPRLGPLVFAIQLKRHDSEWQGSRISLSPPEGNGDSKEYTPDMTEVSLENERRIPGTYTVGIRNPNPIEGATVYTQSEIVVEQKTETADADP